MPIPRPELQSSPDPIPGAASTPATPTWLAVVGTILLGLSLGAYGFGKNVVGRYSEMKTWPGVEGRMLTAKKDRTVNMTKSSRNRTRSDYDVSVTYEYKVRGASYTGNTREAPVESSFTLESSADRWIAQHAPGKFVAVHVNPDVPTESYLDLSTPSIGYVLYGLAGLFGLCSALCYIDIVRQAIRRSPGTSPPTD